MLVLLTVSLIGYVVWQFIQAILDPEHRRSDFSGIIRRIGSACSGSAYAGITWSAAKMFTLSNSGEGKTPGVQALEIMMQPFGCWLVGGLGLMIVGLGGYYFYRAIKADFRKRFKRRHMSDAAKIWATIVGQIGIAARGFVYSVIGAYAIRAAWEFDASIITTTEDALAVFDNNPADKWILATLGIDFIAYGLHMRFQAVYRSIDPL